MKRICEQCGIKTDEAFKFCPECGAEMNIQAETDDTAPAGSEKVKVVLCTICGAENPVDQENCVECGAPIEEDAEVIETEVTVEAPVMKQEQKQAPKGKKSKKEKKKAVPETALSNGQAAGIFIGALAIGFLILFLGGVFDTPETFAGNQNDPHAGVDMNQGVNPALLQQVEELKKQVAADPGNHETLLQLAYTQHDAELFHDAIETYKKYIEVHPGNPDVLVDLGICYFYTQQYTQSDSIIRSAFEIKPAHQIGHLYMGMNSLMQGNDEAAHEWLEKTIAIDPNSPAGKEAARFLQSH